MDRFVPVGADVILPQAVYDYEHHVRTRLDGGGVDHVADTLCQGAARRTQQRRTGHSGAGYLEEFSAGKRAPSHEARGYYATVHPTSCKDEAWP